MFSFESAPDVRVRFFYLLNQSDSLIHCSKNALANRTLPLQNANNFFCMLSLKWRLRCGYND